MNPHHAIPKEYYFFQPAGETRPMFVIVYGHLDPCLTSLTTTSQLVLLTLFLMSHPASWFWRLLRPNICLSVYNPFKDIIPTAFSFQLQRGPLQFQIRIPSPYLLHQLLNSQSQPPTQHLRIPSAQMFSSHSLLLHPAPPPTVGNSDSVLWVSQVDTLESSLAFFFYYTHSHLPIVCCHVCLPYTISRSSDNFHQLSISMTFSSFPLSCFPLLLS